jgi:hypothetical protein
MFSVRLNASALNPTPLIVASRNTLLAALILQELKQLSPLTTFYDMKTHTIG